MISYSTSSNKCFSSCYTPLLTQHHSFLETYHFILFNFIQSQTDAILGNFTNKPMYFIFSLYEKNHRPCTHNSQRVNSCSNECFYNDLNYHK